MILQIQSSHTILKQLEKLPFRERLENMEYLAFVIVETLFNTIVIHNIYIFVIIIIWLNYL